MIKNIKRFFSVATVFCVLVLTFLGAFHQNEVLAAEADQKQMVHIKNGVVGNNFVSLVESKPGISYIVEFTSYSTGEVTPKMLTDSSFRWNTGSSAKISEKKKDTYYTEYSYELTVPKSYNPSADASYSREKDMVFIGFFLSANSESFIGDITVYVKGDKGKTNLLKNHDFSQGLNSWALGNTVQNFDTVTYNGKKGGLTEWKDDSHEINVIPYSVDAAKAIIDDYNRDDGEWWNEKDIVEKTDNSKGSFKGSFKNQDDIPMWDVKLIIRSEENEYVTTTDNDGDFSFDDIKTGFYSIYLLEDSGEEALTDMFFTLSDGDIITGTIITDTSALSVQPEMPKEINWVLIIAIGAAVLLSAAGFVVYWFKIRHRHSNENY